MRFYVKSFNNRSNNEKDNIIVYKEAPPNLEEYYQLFSSTGWVQVLGISENDLEKVLENTFYWVTAYEDEKIAGIGRLLSDGTLYALTCDIIVKPDSQKRGIGSTILSNLIARCKALKLKRVWLFAAPDKAGFYEKHGFFIRPTEAPGMQLGKFEYIT
ncbi:MAG: GNAT family N-acetyltransferase [Methanosarcina sp.]